MPRGALLAQIAPRASLASPVIFSRLAHALTAIRSSMAAKFAHRLQSVRNVLKDISYQELVVLLVTH